LENNKKIIEATLDDSKDKFNNKDSFVLELYDSNSNELNIDIYFQGNSWSIID
jgi:hypothetical protein